MSQTTFPPNPNYGQGVSRRYIRLTNRPGETIGELEDALHAMRCRLTHDGTTITSITSDFVRYPLTTCPSASTMIDTLVGLPLTTTIASYYGEGKARQQCTHMHDLVWWMMSHALRDEGVRLYQCVIPDHPPGREIEARLLLNGEDMLVWRVLDEVILSPEPFAGRNTQKGFVGWATETLEGEALEAALILNKGYFISQAEMMYLAPGPLSTFERNFAGVCYSFSAERLDGNERLDHRREFPDGVGLLDFRSWTP